MYIYIYTLIVPGRPNLRLSRCGCLRCWYAAAAAAAVGILLLLLLLLLVAAASCWGAKLLKTLARCSQIDVAMRSK